MTSNKDMQLKVFCRRCGRELVARWKKDSDFPLYRSTRAYVPYIEVDPCSSCTTKKPLTQKRKAPND